MLKLADFHAEWPIFQHMGQPPVRATSATHVKVPDDMVCAPGASKASTQDAETQIAEWW